MKHDESEHDKSEKGRREEAGWGGGDPVSGPLDVCGP